MSEWQGKSDLEINRAVAILEGHKLNMDCCEEQDIGCYKGCEYENFALTGEPPSGNAFDYCNLYQDSLPIVIENRISMTPHNDNEWMAVKQITFNIYATVIDENPLRAAMIVYLEMNGVKPNE